MPWTSPARFGTLPALSRSSLLGVAMNACLHLLGRLFRHARWCLTAILLVALTGCAGWNTKEDRFHENDLSNTAQTARAQKADKDKDANCLGLTEKGRQIERDLNAM